MLELAADRNQLLWSFYVPIVTAFQSHSTMKGLTRASGSDEHLFFCLVTEWSESRVELEGVFQEVALEAVEWFINGFYWSAVCTG